MSHLPVTGTGASVPRPDDQVHLEGVVERVTFHNAESGFCVLRVKARGQSDLVTVLGHAATVQPGELVECHGRWVMDKRYGRQLQSTLLHVTPPGTLEGIRRYLASGMVHGVGPHFAKKLVDAFGDQVFEVIESTPQRLRELPGIGEKRQQRLVESWRQHKAVRRIMVFLQSHGIGTARAVRIYRTYGDEAVEKIRQDPYRLSMDIQGVGFKTADALAQRMGIPPDSPMRARAALRHWLQELAGTGHCAAAEEDAVQGVAAMLGLDTQAIQCAVREEVQAQGAVREEVEGRWFLALPALHRAELGVARHLLRLRGGRPPWGEIEREAALHWVRGRTGTRLSASQEQALRTILDSRFAVVTGGPGVGKTTLLNSLLKIVGARGMRIRLAAPTGRAARRLSESTGLEARTLHRLLEVDPQHGGFKRGRERPLDADLIVVDEASMIDVVLMNALLRAIPDRAATLLVGDVDQLPSVGPGAVLADIIAADVVPVAHLTEVFRQAASSRIVTNAHRVNAGHMPLKGEGPDSDFHIIHRDTPEDIAGTVIELVCRRIPSRFGADPLADIQVLAPMHRGPAGTRALNEALQARLNGQAQPRVSRFGYEFALGDKVMQTVNDYEKDVFNGDIGRIAGIDEEQGTAHIHFDGRKVEYELDELDEVQPAYAVSVHKSQGSEYPVVVIPLATAHYMMLARNLLYTAMTRGKHLVVLVAQPKALAIAVHNARAGERITHLAWRLKRLAAAPQAAGDQGLE